MGFFKKLLDLEYLKYLGWYWAFIFKGLVGLDWWESDRRATSYVKRGVVQAHLGDFDQAIADFSTAIQLQNDNREAFFERGQVCWHVGRFRDAIFDLRIAAESLPLGRERDFSTKERKRLFDIYFLLGDSYRQLGAHDRAIFHSDIAIRNNPADARGYFCRGRAYWDKNDPDRAIADFSEAIRLDPGLRPAVPLTALFLLAET